MWDSEGKQYLDFSGSAAVNFIGHGLAEISAAMADQISNLEFAHSSQFTTPVTEEYGQELLDFAGAEFRGGCAYFTSGGSESIETALKLARQYQVEIGQRKRYKVRGATRVSQRSSSNSNTHEREQSSFQYHVQRHRRHEVGPE